MQLKGSVKNQPSYVPTGRVWPSGDFSLGYRKVEPDSRVDMSRHLTRIDRCEMAVPDRPGWSQGAWGFPVVDDSALDVNGTREALSVAAECEVQEEYARSSIEDRLDPTTPPNSHTRSDRPEKYGKLGITGYGRKMVKSAATLIQKMPNKRVTFATVTMPSLPPQLRRELALAWPELLRQLIQWLCRQLKAAGLPGLICSVTEIQPGRLATRQEAYLHLHLVWPNHYAKSGNWAVDVDRLRTWLAEFLQRKGIWAEGAWVNVDTKQVKKTAAGYLSKYMSKGSVEIEAFAADCGWDAVPGQWWNLSKPARDMVNRFVCSGDATGALLKDVVEYALDNRGLNDFHVIRPAILVYDGVERIAGWYGVLVEDIRLRLVKVLRDNSRIIAA